MSNIFTYDIKDIKANSISGQDIYVENTLLIKKDTILTKRLITLLKNRNVKTISIVDELKMEVPLEDGLHVGNNGFLNEKDDLSTTDLKNIFIKSMEQVSRESRYGNILKKKSEMDLIEKIFLGIMKNPTYSRILFQLREWDYYSFIHSFDVFVLGTLFAYEENIGNLEELALGYLFHDIGKLFIPQNLLKQNGKLSFEEFSLIKSHTIRGYEKLQSMDLGHIAIYAKYHHERQDGTGYPEGLVGNQLTNELKILQIVDVYSALTTKRIYKEAYSTSETLSLIYRDVNKFDIPLLSRFVEYLKVYPENSIVLLSDNTYAKVKHVNESLPWIPKVSRIDKDSIEFFLPNDFQLKIEKMITYESEKMDDIFQIFIRNLLMDNKMEVKNEYEKLIDGLKLEEVYTKVLIPTYNTVKILFEQNFITDGEFNNSMESLKEMSEEKRFYLSLEKAITETVIIIIPQEYFSHPIIKFLQGLFQIEKIYPIILRSTATFENISAIISSCMVKSICMINMEILNGQFRNLQQSHIKLHHIAFNKIEKVIQSIRKNPNKSLDLYQELFENSEPQVFEHSGG